jgi:ankyrin repeat protein
MGACCSTTDKSEKKSKTSKPEIKVHKKDANDTLEIARKYKQENRDNNHLIRSLEAGDLRAVELEIENGQDINDYIFESNTENLLLAAARITKNPEIIHIILKNGADINAPQTENGYTALLSTCIDLKVEIVHALLQHKPKLKITLKEGSHPIDILVYLKEFLIDLVYTKKSALTPEEKVKYDRIMEMLKQYQYQNADVQQLDEERKQFNNARDSGKFDRL